MSLVDFANSTTMKIILAAVAAWAGWTAQGWRMDAAINNMQRDQVVKKITAIERKVVIENAISASLDKNAGNLQKENDDAKTDREIALSDLRSGAIRMSIPVRNAGRTSTADAAATAGSDRHETRAELNIATAEDLETIAGDGDDAIRQLNSCIDSYNDVREKFNQIREDSNVQAK